MLGEQDLSKSPWIGGFRGPNFIAKYFANGMNFGEFKGLLRVSPPVKELVCKGHLRREIGQAF
jgi:hypothetical protein